MHHAITLRPQDLSNTCRVNGRRLSRILVACNLFSGGSAIPVPSLVADIQEGPPVAEHLEEQAKRKLAKNIYVGALLELVVVTSSGRMERENDTL